jgi:hypothetical protein
MTTSLDIPVILRLLPQNLRNSDVDIIEGRDL